MIIGISGYSGSGKDTVGAIIQYIIANQKKPLSLPVEKMVTDIDEFGLFLESESEWEIRKFAGKLKDIASHLTGFDIEDFEDQNFKKTNLGREWWTVDYIKRYKEDVPTEDSIPVEITEVMKPMTVRDFLQKLGTDALRNGLHPNVWVNALMVDYDKECNWIITDTRFQNEAIAIKNKGGIIIRVERPGIKPINDHPSETELDGWNFDYKIQNIDDIFALKQIVEQILKHANLL
jgi:hypothetical protein